MRTTRAVLLLILVAGLGSASTASADDHIKGIITGRGNDGTVTMRTDDATTMILVLNDASKVRRVDGLRRNDESSASLIPGLRIDVAGEHQGTDHFSVNRVTFSQSAMKTALAIKGGVEPTDLRSLDNQRRLDENARMLAQQQQTLARQSQEIAANRELINSNQEQLAEKIVATSGLIDSRIANLDNYNTVSSLTIHFRNGSASLTPGSKAQLQEIAAQAKNLDGYMIQVQGYASAVGSNEVNQRLSAQRAAVVTAALQQGGVPPTSMAVPAAMGTSEQVASNKTAWGQAENRRTVVTLLQSKGITGK
jgi:outer membrane protein OmpA-like peptidoglycan-associated protein